LDRTKKYDAPMNIDRRSASTHWRKSNMGKDKSDPAESALEIERLRAMHHETTDPMAARLLGDVLSELEAAFPAEKDASDEPTP
jgi:hypothetical protein